MPVTGGGPNMLGLLKIHPGKYGQWIQALAGALCSFTAGQVAAWTGPALPMIRNGSAGFTMSLVEESWMVTAVFCTNVISPLIAGWFMDRIGRKNTLMCSAFSVIASWLVIYWGKSAVALYIARCLVGIWSGTVYTVVPVLNAETFDPEIRGAAGALFGVSLYVGALFETIVGMNSTYDTLTLASLVPPVVLVIVLLFLPESPYFYLMKEKEERAAESLRFLKGSCDRQKLDALNKTVKEQLGNKGTLLCVFKVKAYRRAFFISTLLAGFRSMAGFAVLLAYATVTIPPSFVNPQTAFLLLIVVWTIGSSSSTFLMDRLGRKPLLFASSVGSCITMLGVASWYYLHDRGQTGDTDWMPLVGFLTNGVFFSLGLVSVPILIQGELFPVNIKGKASALTVVTIALTSGLSVKLYQPLVDNIGLYSNLLLCAASAAGSAIASVTILIETKGKTLEEIQEILSGKAPLQNDQKKGEIA